MKVPKIDPRVADALEAEGEARERAGKAESKMRRAFRAYEKARRRALAAIRRTKAAIRKVEEEQCDRSGTDPLDVELREARRIDREGFREGP